MILDSESRTVGRASVILVAIALIAIDRRPAFRFGRVGRVVVVVGAHAESGRYEYSSPTFGIYSSSEADGLEDERVDESERAIRFPMGWEKPMETTNVVRATGERAGAAYRSSVGSGEQEGATSGPMRAHHGKDGAVPISGAHRRITRITYKRT